MGEVKERRAKIFKNGRSRAVRIPADFDLNATEVILRQSGDGDITISTKSATEAFFEALRRVQVEYPFQLGEELTVIDDRDLLPLDDEKIDRLFDDDR